MWSAPLVLFVLLACTLHRDTPDNSCHCRGERREEVRTKRRSRRGRLRGRGTQTQVLSLQSQCRNLMKVLMGKREGGCENGRDDEGEGGRVWAGNGVGTQ